MAQKMGWWPSKHDPVNDYVFPTKAILQATKAKLPSLIDLSGSDGPVEDQDGIGCCTAMGVKTAMQRLRSKAKKFVVESALFNYWGSRKLLGWTGDSGATVKAAMQAAHIYGECSEADFSLVDRNLNRTPPEPIRQAALKNKVTAYYRLDHPGMTALQLHESLQTAMAVSGQIVVGGFTVYSNYVKAKVNGLFPDPVKGLKIVGGHCVAFEGYDEGLYIGNKRGAYMFKNSWSPSWAPEFKFNGKDMPGYNAISYKNLLSTGSDFWVATAEEGINVPTPHLKIPEHMIKKVPKKARKVA
jgi:hypothetical protein